MHAVWPADDAVRRHHHQAVNGKQQASHNRRRQRKLILQMCDHKSRNYFVNGKVCACNCVCECVCMYTCVREREREGGKEGEGERDKASCRTSLQCCYQSKFWADQFRVVCNPGKIRVLSNHIPRKRRRWPRWWVRPWRRGRRRCWRDRCSPCRHAGVECERGSNKHVDVNAIGCGRRRGWVPLCC